MTVKFWWRWFGGWRHNCLQIFLNIGSSDALFLKNIRGFAFPLPPRFVIVFTRIFTKYDDPIKILAFDMLAPLPFSLPDALRIELKPKCWQQRLRKWATATQTSCCFNLRHRKTSILLRKQMTKKYSIWGFFHFINPGLSSHSDYLIEIVGLYIYTNGALLEQHRHL